MRRGVNMTYIVENNGVYGLTKGQFSATADRGSKAKRGAINTDEGIDLVLMALQLGATYVARSFSGDKGQLVPLIKGALTHEGAAFIDILSPCVAFNNHEGSTKSFDYVREHNEAVNQLDVITMHKEITTAYEPGAVQEVRQHDGSVLRLRKLEANYDASDRIAAMTYVQSRYAIGEIATGETLSRHRSQTSPRQLEQHVPCRWISFGRVPAVAERGTRKAERQHAMKPVIDLRSDTVTRPPPAMREAMARAEVGDDVFGDDPTVNRLQEICAERFGMHAGLFPSGTQSNLAAAWLLRSHGEEVIIVGQARAHTYLDMNAKAQLTWVYSDRSSRSRSRTGPTARSTSGKWKRRSSPTIRISPSRGSSRWKTRSAEKRLTARLWRALTATVRRRGLSIHLDGARIFNAAVKLGMPVKDLCEGFDTVSMCLIRKD